MSAEGNNANVLVGQLLEDDYMLTLDDLCRSCLVKTETVTTLVAEGILDPTGEDVEQWQFSIGSVRRVRTVIHLQRDLGVNLAGAALALELLDQITELRRR